MSKAWDLSCVCKGEYETCTICISAAARERGPVWDPTSARERFQAELERAAARQAKPGRQAYVPCAKFRTAEDFRDHLPCAACEPKKADHTYAPDPDPDGYHLAKIAKGVYGESSKILEEVLELQDAEAQGARIMALNELSDILGAVHGYLRKHYPDTKFEDVIRMANITRRAFESGHRK